MQHTHYHGSTQKETEAAGKLYPLKELQTKYNEGGKSGVPHWHSIPQLKKFIGDKVIQGTVKRVNCTELLVKSKSIMCTPCSDLLKEKPSQKGSNV